MSGPFAPRVAPSSQPRNSAQEHVQYAAYAFHLFAGMMQNERILTNAVAMIRPEYLQSRAQQVLFQAIREWYASRRVLPLPTDAVSAAMIIGQQMNPPMMAEDQTEMDQLLSVASAQTAQTSEELVLRDLPNFVRFRRMQSLLNAATGMTTEALIRASTEIHNDLAAPDIKISGSWTDPEPILTAEQLTYIGTNLPALNSRIGGGLRPGMVGMVIACPGVGKTTALINFSEGAVIGDYRSLIITLELSGQRIKHRHQAISAGIPAKLYQTPQCDWPVSELRRYTTYAQRHPRRDYVQVADMSERKHTLLDVERVIETWRKGVFDQFSAGGTCTAIGERERAKCVSVYLDWLDQLSAIEKPRNKSDADWEVLMGQTRELGMQARRGGYATWTATQAGKSAIKKEVLNQGDTAFSFHKADHVDIALGLAPALDQETGVGAESVQRFKDDDDDDDAEAPSSHVSSGRMLVFSSMKNRDNPQFSLEVRQDKTLRFYHSAREESRMNEALGSPLLTEEERMGLG